MVSSTSAQAGPPPHQAPAEESSTRKKKRWGRDRAYSVEMQLDKRGSTVFDVDKDELFDIVTKNEEKLTRGDFDKLHAVISEQAKKEIADKISNSDVSFFPIDLPGGDADYVC